MRRENVKENTSQYVEPVIEIISFQAKDMLTTSNPTEPGIQLPADLFETPNP